MTSRAAAMTRSARSTLLSVQSAPSWPRWRWLLWYAWMVVLLGAMVLVLVLSKRDPVTEDVVAPAPELVVFTVLAWLPLWLMPRRPHLALVGAAAAEALHIALVPLLAPGLEPVEAIVAYQPVPLATMVAAWTVSSRVTRGWIWATAAGVVLALVGVVSRPADLLLTNFVTFNVVQLVTAVGAAVTAGRDRAARLVRREQEAAQTAVTDERLRIARDLHDVLAHHLALVNAQAGVAAYLVRSDPTAAATALDDMALHTRQALDGLRATVGLLRRGDEADTASTDDPALCPPPDLDRIDGLLASLRTTGVAVRSAVRGEPGELDADAGVAAFRIVQEALTNATKHAPGAPVDVVLTWSDEMLEITVGNGPAPRRLATPAPGGRHGLVGMRERATSCGGDFAAGPARDGGFTVHARLPAHPAGTGAGTIERITR